MDTTSTLPTREDDARTLREITAAVAIAVVVGLLVFLSIIGVISLINGDKTLDAIHKNTTATEHIAQEDHRLNAQAARFFRTSATTILNFEHNAYLACVASGAQGCIPPRMPG